MNVSKIEEIIKSEYPQFLNSTFVVNDKGWSNLVFEIDNKYIIRIPRNEESLSDLKFEKEMLPLIIREINVKVPRFIINSTPNSEYEYVGYERIEGVPLSDEVLQNQSTDVIENFAVEIGRFLSGLHSVKPVETSPNINMYEKWGKLKETLFSEAKTYLSVSQIEQIDGLFEKFKNYLLDQKLNQL